MQTMKINVAKNHMLNFYGFTAQIGMLLGYDENNTPYVTNGTIQADGGIYVYFLKGENIFGENEWIRQKIFLESSQIYKKNIRGVLYNTILKGIKRRGKNIEYMTKLQKESERWGRKEYLNGSVLFNGCHSNHYNFQMTRPTY